MDANDEVIGIMDRKQRNMGKRIRELEAEIASRDNWIDMLSKALDETKAELAVRDNFANEVLRILREATGKRDFHSEMEAAEWAAKEIEKLRQEVAQLRGNVAAANLTADLSSGREFDAVMEYAALARQNAALRAALEVFGNGSVIEAIEREDFSVMKERIVDWFGPSDFKKAKSALALTPPAALEDFRRREREAALLEAANLIRQTTPDATDDEFSKGKYDGRIYAIEQIESMADAITAERGQENK